MNQRLKERLVGAAVLVVIAVIFIPMILTGPIDTGEITETNIPQQPEEKFTSKVIPLDESMQPISVQEQGKEEKAAASTKELEQKQNEAETAENENKEPDKVVDTVNSAKNKQVGLTAWVVQLGSFESKENAESLNQKLRKAGFPAFVEPITQNNKTAYRVRVGPELLHTDADKLLDKINKKMKLKGIVLGYP